MNIATLEIQLTRAEGALVRIMGLLTRRGFDITDVTAATSSCGGHYTLRIAVQGPRSIDVLTRQIAKLYDVAHVHIADTAREV